MGHDDCCGGDGEAIKGLGTKNGKKKEKRERKKGIKMMSG